MRALEGMIKRHVRQEREAARDDLDVHPMPLVDGCALAGDAKQAGFDVVGQLPRLHHVAVLGAAPIVRAKE